MLLLPAEALARTARSAKPVPKKYAMYYDSKACRAVASRSSACNKGKEPFYKFLAKFNTSRIFRMSRTKLDETSMLVRSAWGLWDENEYYDSGYEGRISPDLLIFEPGFYDTCVCTFKNVTADSVEFGEYDLPEPFDGGFGGGWSTHAKFQRIDGKWYCTHFHISS